MRLLDRVSPARLRKPVNDLLSEDLMTLLAFLIIPTVLLPYLLILSPFTLALFEVLNYGIIAAFVLEYGLKLYVAEARVKYILDFWHVLDLLIILLALAEFLPFVATSAGRVSPLFRLLRLLRVTAAAGRSIKGRTPRRAEGSKDPQVSRMTVNVLTGGKVSQCTMADPECRIPTRAGTWVDLQEVAGIDLRAISENLAIPRFILENRIVDDSFPRIDHFKDVTAIFFWNSRLGPETATKGINIIRHGLLIVCEKTRIVTLSSEKNDLFETIAGTGLSRNGEGFTVQVLLAILKKKAGDWEEIMRDIEYRAMVLEELPVGRVPPSFLEDTFLLKKEARKAAKNLWHTKKVLENLKDGKVSLEGVTDELLAQFDLLYDEIDYMYETIQNIIEGLGSLRDLHINTVSYEMNKVMRILAIVTCIAIIPTTVGGLLGENLMDTPYPISIGEISLLVVSSMLLAVYGFYKMGWFR